MLAHFYIPLLVRPGAGGGTGASAAEIWAWELSNGKTAEQSCSRSPPKRAVADDLFTLAAQI